MTFEKTPLDYDDCSLVSVDCLAQRPPVVSRDIKRISEVLFGSFILCIIVPLCNQREEELG